MHKIDARCFSGSEIALTEIDALLAARTVVDDCWFTTNNNLQITTKVLIPNKWQTYQTFVICSKIADFAKRNERDFLPIEKQY